MGAVVDGGITNFFQSPTDGSRIGLVGGNTVEAAEEEDRGVDHREDGKNADGGENSHGGSSADILSHRCEVKTRVDEFRSQTPRGTMTEPRIACSRPKTKAIIPSSGGGRFRNEVNGLGNS